MKELGLANQSMRPFIKERNTFFRSQDRLDRLKKWVEPDDREEDMDLKMLTVLTRAAQPEPFAILMKLMDSFCRDDKFDQGMESKAWKDIETLGLAPSFWQVMTQTFGYVNESSPILMDLLIKVFVTDFANNSAMSKDKGREFVKPHRVIYIYHDQIDAVGDKAVSENKTFEAVITTIDELTALVGLIINSLNGTRIMITSDHGFIYQEKDPAQLDKSMLEMPPDAAVKKHKRFIPGKELGKSKELGKYDNVFSGSTKQTSNTDTDMHFWLPKGTNRFHFVGGAKFFHGGAMLQEITIPVVTVSEMRGIHKEKSQINSVGVSILGSTKKIVTNIPRFELIQTDAVSGRMKSRRMKISLRDGNDFISNEGSITCTCPISFRSGFGSIFFYFPCCKIIRN